MQALDKYIGGEVMATKTGKTAGKKCGCGDGCRCCNSKSTTAATKSCGKARSQKSASIETATETNSCSRATRTCSKAKKGVKSCAGSRSSK